MRPEFRFVKPARHRFAEHPAAHTAAPGNHQNASLAVGSRAANERGEYPVRLTLGHSVQVESRVDVVLAALQPLRVGSVNAGEAVKRERR